MTPRVVAILRKILRQRQKFHAYAICPMPNRLGMNRNRMLGVYFSAVRLLQPHHQHCAQIPSLFCQQIHSRQADFADAVRRRWPAVPIIGNQTRKNVALGPSALLAQQSPQKSLYWPPMRHIRSFPLPNETFRNSLHQSLFYLVSRADDQLISWLRLRRINRMGGQFQHARSMDFERPNAKSREVLGHTNDAIILIQINQIQRKQHAPGMNSARRDHPESFVGPHVEPSNQPFQALENSIRRGDAQTEEAFSCLVVYAVGRCFHVIPRALAVPAIGRSIHARSLTRIRASMRFLASTSFKQQSMLLTSGTAIPPLPCKVRRASRSIFRWSVACRVAPARQ